MATYFCGCGRCTLKAVTGPLMMMAVGALFALDQLGMHHFSQTWPALLIVYGLIQAAAFFAPAHDRG